MTTDSAARSALTAHLERVVDDLAYRYADSASRAQVAELVAAERARLEPESRHLEHLPALIEHAVRDRIEQLAHAAGQQARPVPELLFVCVHNAGRSQMAAAFAEHLSGGHVHVRLAGLAPTGLRNPLVADVMRERGIELDHDFSPALVGDVVHAADVVVDMGAELDGVPARRVLDWDVADPHEQPIEAVRTIRDDIEGRVRGLLGELGVPVGAA
ncbi:MAG: arsenate reductase ArsC [Micrococcales bacterium]|nr:arsenate reductase ArsC [Micrococcales bacterium]